MKSLKSIREEFKGFWEGHKQIALFHYGAIEDYIAITDKKYFAVNIEFGGANVSGRYITYSFSIVIADLMDISRPDTEHDAVSNCILIGNDFLAWLTSQEYTYTGANYQPFREDTGDITAGVVLILSLQFPLASNECTIPS